MNMSVFNVVKKIGKGMWKLFGSEDNDDNVDNAKLEAQKITDFSGNANEWQAWKSRTLCAFQAAGYDKVLTNEKYAKEHPNKTALVYSHLRVALNFGLAHYHAQQYEDSSNAYLVWQALIESYQGESVIYEQAERIRQKLNNLKLYPGGLARVYTSEFMSCVYELDRIPNENMSETYKVQSYLNGILDEDYETQVTYSRTHHPLAKATALILSYERSLITKRKNKRRNNNTVRRIDGKRQRTEVGNSKHQNDGEEDTRMDDIEYDGIVTVGPNGRIRVKSESWQKKDLIPNEHKEFIRMYNSQSRNSDSPETLPIPDGLIVIHSTDTKRRNNNSSPQKGKQSKKKIHFHLQHE